MKIVRILLIASLLFLPTAISVLLSECFPAYGVQVRFPNAAGQSNHHNVNQNQTQQQSQTQQATAKTGDQANNQTTSFVTPHLAPDVIAPPAYPSAPCRVAYSGGASFLTGGGAFGSSKMDDECDKREDARAFEGIGEHRAALQILCTTDKAINADVKVCHQFWADVQDASHPWRKK